MRSRVLNLAEQHRFIALFLHGTQYAHALNHEHQARCLSLLACDGAQA